MRLRFLPRSWVGTPVCPLMMGSRSMGTGVPGEGSGREYEWALPLIAGRSLERVFSRSEVRRRREGESRKACRSSREPPREEEAGRCGRDISVRGMQSVVVTPVDH